MPIPDFQSIMLPFLKYLSDGAERSNSDVVDALARRFRLSDEELDELLPSGTQRLFHNRVAWAKSHMKMAGLVDAPHRGMVKITDRGVELLKQNPDGISMKTLMNCPEYIEFRQRKNEQQPPEIEKGGNSNREFGLTPEEQLDQAYSSIRSQLVTEILEKVSGGSPQFFERLVVELLVAMGYGGSRRDAGRTVGRSGDEGIDGVIKEDRLGLDTIYLQAKRWQGAVGRPEIQKFAGALQGQRAKKGVFITTSSFTKEAEDFANKIDNKIVLIDGDRLAELMIDHDVGVSQVAQYDIKRIDSDYFEEV